MTHVFDADGHICEPPRVWLEYAERPFRDRVLQVRKLDQPWSELFAEGHGLGVNPAPACIVGRLADDVDWSEILPGSYEPSARLDVMTAEGIDEACFFPSIYLLYGDIRDPEVAAATCRAYNRWIADFCKHNPSRLHAVGLVPLQSPKLAVEEAKRISDLGLRGLCFRPERFDGLALYDPSLDPLWTIAVEQNLPVCVHGSFGTRMPSFATGRYQSTNTFFTHMICHPFEQMAAVLDLIGGGVLDRFPRLRVGFFESGLSWLPYWLHRLDEHFEVMGHLAPQLRRRPTEIFREQCFVSMEAEEKRGLETLVELGLVGSVLWGSDYPHYDAKYPGAYAAAEATFIAVGPDVRDQIVDRNPRRFFDLAPL
jgi:predicted TIM-barrel fold metal-dependent hydrolase